jgi:hypothetical protein
LTTLRDHSRLQRATVKRAKLELAAKQVNPAAAAIGVPGRNITGVNDMETINAGNGLSIYLPLALYLVVAIVGWRLMKRRRRSKAERATYWQTCYIKLNSLAKSHRRQAAEFEIQAEKFRLRWQQEQRALQKRRFDEMFFKK